MRYNNETAYLLNEYLVERKEAVKRNDLTRVAKLDKRIHEKKLILREQSRRKESRNYEIIIRGCDSDESFWDKTLFPGQKWSKEEIDDYIRENWMHVRSPWDCSGEIFTRGIEVFNSPSGVIVYHFMSIDI